nr:TIGR02710 family CRISPR-associated CARF protein [Thermostichus vulcanus]
MKTVLFVTVGGSPPPIITAIKKLNPERVIFVCSSTTVSQVTGSGTPCEIHKGSDVIERLPNIPTQANLGERFDPEQDVVVLESLDDLSECYRVIAAKMAEIRQDPGNIVQADYTGGTKTMSLALGLAGLDYEAKLFLTTGERTDTVRVNRGEMTMQVSLTPVMVERLLKQKVPPLVAQYNYPAALVELENLVVAQGMMPDDSRRVRNHRSLCLALDAWDRFDHLEAWAYLQPLMKQKWIQPLGLFLKRVMSSRGLIDPEFDGSQGSPGHGYEIVEDLLLNAERRASQQRFDDAVGRIYRALELLAQVRLKQKYEIETGNVDPQRLPEALRTHYQNRQGKIEIALRKSYELLSQLGGDPLGKLFQERQSLIADALQVRNHSLFAHGFQPITQSDYQKMQGSLVAFIREGVQLLAAELNFKKSSSSPQFPQDFLFEQP